MRPPPFDSIVPENGYHWWYVDALDETGDNGLVVIVFVGSVFSPYYFAARKKGQGDPSNFCAVNVGIYQGRAKRWSMTERGSSSLQRDINSLTIGPSSVQWRDGGFEIHLDERSAPLCRKVRGRVALYPKIISDRVFNLDGAGRHHWHPWCPQASVEVELTEPDLKWRGNAYLDSNWGNEPLENGFSDWEWSRCHRGDEVLVDYHSNRSDGSHHALSLVFSAARGCREMEGQNAQKTRKSGWGVRRSPRSSEPLELLRTLEDTPFYARSLFRSGTPGSQSLLVHESLSLERFRKSWVRCLLPFRMPRKRS